MRELERHIRALEIVVVMLTLICVRTLVGYDSLLTFGMFILKIAVGIGIGLGIGAAGGLLVRMADRRKSPRKVA